MKYKYHMTHKHEKTKKKGQYDTNSCIEQLISGLALAGSCCRAVLAQARTQTVRRDILAKHTFFLSFFFSQYETSAAAQSTYFAFLFLTHTHTHTPRWKES